MVGMSMTAPSRGGRMLGIQCLGSMYCPTFRNTPPWLPKRAGVVSETRLHGFRNAPPWFPKRASRVSESCLHGSRNAVMVSES